MILFLTTTALASELPLKETRYTVLITGPYAEVTVEQTFSNPNEGFIEAIYSFPLHQQSAVDDMSMRMGDRVVKGEIQTREQARQTYEEARERGQTAALTEQERPNLFTQSVANIAPGEDIHVSLHMTQPLSYDEGVYTFDLPLTVGPRFAPAGMVEDAEKVTRPTAIAPTGATVDIDVRIEMGMPVEEIWSSTHEPAVGMTPTGAEIVLDDLHGDRDFVLNIDPESDQPIASLKTA